MGKIIEAKAVISAEDRTGRTFDQIARKFKEVGKGAKISAEIDRMSKSLKGVQDNMRSLTDYQGKRSAFYTARNELTAARKAADEASRALANAAKPTRELQDAMRKTQRAVERTTEAFERQKTEVFAARRTLTQNGLSASHMIRQQADLGKAFDRTSRAIGRQHALSKAEGGLTEGMSTAGRRQHAKIAQDRYLIEGMGAAGRAAIAERDQRQQAIADAKNARSAERRDAAGTLAAGAGLYIGHKGKEIGLEAINSAARMDYAVRYQHIATDVSEAMQKNLLLPQAKRIGQETKFSNEDVVEAQTATMQGLPYKDPDIKAKVGAALVDEARNYAVLFQSTLTSGSEGLRSFLQNTNKDMSTPEKAAAEAKRGTNLIVKAAKLGGMNNEDAQQYIKFGVPTATQAGFSDVTTMALGALARRSGLKGDEAGVFVRAASSKLISPTKEGREAEIMAGIDRSKYQTMPEQLSSEAFEKIGKGRFGVHFSANQRGRLSTMFRDGDLLTDQAEFTKRVSDVVGESFEKNKKGKLKAQDAAKIAKLANDFYKMSVQSTDVEGLLQAHMNSPTFTTALRNKFYTDKHGGKAGILATHFDQFKEDREALDHVTKEPNFAGDRAKYMTEGLGGSIDNLKGSFETLVLNIGTANRDLVQGTSDQVSKIADAVSGLSEKTVQAGTVFAAVAASGASAASALAILGNLTGSPVLAGLAALGAAGMAPILAALATTGVLYAASDEKKGLVHGGRPDQTMNPGDELPGLDGATDKPSWTPPPARSDASGQVGAINNTLDKAATASSTAANGGKPVEATVKPDQITAQVKELPAVTGEAKVEVENQINVRLQVDESWINAKIETAAGRAAAKIPLASSGARPGAVSMPGAAATPGAAAAPGGK